MSCIYKFNGKDYTKDEFYSLVSSSNFIQQEQAKKFAELQERLNNKEFLEGAKNAFESSEELQNVYYEAAGFSQDIKTKKTGLLDYFLNVKKDSVFQELIQIGETLGIGIEEYESNSPLQANWNGKNVTINKTYGKVTSNVIAHEVVHGILHTLTNNDYTNSKLNLKLEKFKTELFDYIEKRGINNLNLPSELRILKLDYIKKMSNQEIVTYAFTDSQFSDFLASIKTDTKVNSNESFWNKLINIFNTALKELGFTSKLDELIDILNTEVPLFNNVQITPQQKQDALNAYTDYIARVSLGIIKNPTSGEYNYTSKVKDIVYHDGGRGKIKQEGFRKDLIGISDGGVLGNGFYFYFNKLEKYDESRSHTESVLLNTKNPKTLKQIENEANENNYEKAIEILSGIKIDPYIKGSHGKYIGNYAEALSKAGIDAVYSYKRRDEIALKTQFFNKVLNIIGINNIKNLYKNSDIKLDFFKIKDIEIGNNKDFIITIENQDKQNTAFNLRIDGSHDRLKISEGSKTIRGIVADLSNKKTAMDVLIKEYKTNEPNTQPSQIVVFEPEQIHVLASKADIEGFKEFVDKNNSISDISSLGKLQGDLMESEKGQIGVNKQQLLMLLGPTMYNKPLAQVAVKELLQNSFDAIKARMNITDNKETGNIDIKVDYDNRTISIKDDGIGMTPDIVKNAFLSIGGTNKEGLNVSERSGGFGLAKVQFLLGSEYVKVITIRDGIKTSLEATAVQLYNDDFTINKEQTNEPNGSYVEVKIPESYTTPEGTKREIEFPGRWKDDVKKYRAFDILDKPLIGNVNVSFTHVKNKKEYKRIVPIGENTTEETLPPLFSKIDFVWGSADLYMSTDKKENPKHRILSSGIYQFNYSFRFKDWEDIPYDIVINIKPSVSSTSEQYPFNNQREGFKNTVQEDIKSLNNYLKKYASGEAEKDAKAVFSNITGLPKVDPNKVLTPEEREKLYADVEKTIAENKQRRIEQGLESAEEELRKIWKLVIDKEGVKDAETGKVEVSNEKNYSSSFKAEKEIEKVEAIETTNFNPALPQYHNNTNFDYLKIPGAAEFFSDFGSVVLEMVRFAGNELSYDYRKLKSEDEKFFAGVSIDKQYGGVHVRKIINAIFVNPLAFDVSSLEEAVGVALHVTIHEINHTTVSGEGADFTTALGILYGKIYATGKYGLYEGLFRSVYKKHFETFKQLKNEYDKSSTRNLSESFSGDKIKKSITGNVQRDVDDVSTGQSSAEGYTGNQEDNTKDKTGDIILSKFLGSKQDIQGFKDFVQGKQVKEQTDNIYLHEDYLNNSNILNAPFIPPTHNQLNLLKQLDNKSVKEVLEFVISNTQREDLKYVAEVYLKNVNKIHFVKFKSTPISGLKGGHYDAGKAEILFNPLIALTDTQIIERSGFEKALGVILHEFSHTFTIDALFKPKNKEEVEFKNFITEQFKYYKQITPFKDNYGFKNEREFISEILTNRDFRSDLYYRENKKEIKNNYLKNILDKILKFLGFKTNNVKEESPVEIINTILSFVNDYSKPNEYTKSGIIANNIEFQKLTAEEKARTIEQITKEQNNSLFGLNTQNQEQLEFHINTLNVVSKFLENVGVEQRFLSLTEAQVNLLAGRMAKYNRDNNTSHHFFVKKIKNTDLYTVDFKINYLPKKIAVKQQELFDKNIDWGTPNSDVMNKNARGFQNDLKFFKSEETFQQSNQEKNESFFSVEEIVAKLEAENIIQKKCK